MSLVDDFNTENSSRPREFVIEDYLKRKVGEAGGKCYKFVSPGCAGMPDRVILYKGAVVFVECKRPGAKPRPLQEKRAQEIREQGVPCFCVSTADEVDKLVMRLAMHG